MDYVEGNRYLYFSSPVDGLLLSGFRGQESISRLFSFELDLLLKNDQTLQFEDLIGQKVTFGVQGVEARQAPRYFNGTVIELAEGSRDREFTGYSMTVVPDVWKLTRKFRSRIYQHMTIPDVLKDVLSGFDVSYELGQYQPREYITQYQETDFAFASRLMEEEGIFYFFKFSNGSHQLVLADTRQSHPDVPDYSKLVYEELEGGDRDEERISGWQKAQLWGSGKHTLWDHNFQLPHKHLDDDQIVKDTVTAGKITHKLKIAGNDGFQVLEHPGRYGLRFDGINKGGGEQPSELSKIFTDNKRTNGIRMEQMEMPMLEVRAMSNYRQITSGHKFTLQRHFNGDGQYVITEASHNAKEGSFRSDDPTAENQYGNSFNCIPFDLPYRPQRMTARPLISGPQTAVVVGPSGEEIFTEKYGRVKVKFMWDPASDSTDNTCWMRVATFWAGSNWGGIHIPRIGQEVVVAFENGDPDHPIVIGSVYNPDQMPPYVLPDKKTVSTVKSRSSKGGGKDNYNELRFEDLKGKEQVYFQAERDMDERVKHDSREWIGNDRHLIVTNNQVESVTADKDSKVKGNYTFSTQGTHDITVGQDFKAAYKANVNHTISGDERIEIAGSSSLKILLDRKEEIQAGNLSITLDVGNTYQKNKAGNWVVECTIGQIGLKATAGIVLQCGASSISLTPASIAITAPMVLINSGGVMACPPCTPASPDLPDRPHTAKDPDQADDGTHFDKSS